MVVGPSFGRPITEFHRRKSSYSTKEKAATLRRHSSLVVFFLAFPFCFIRRVKSTLMAAMTCRTRSRFFKKKFPQVARVAGLVWFFRLFYCFFSLYWRQRLHTKDIKTSWPTDWFDPIECVGNKKRCFVDVWEQKTRSSLDRFEISISLLFFFLVFVSLAASFVHRRAPAGNGGWASFVWLVLWI